MGREFSPDPFSAHPIHQSTNPPIRRLTDRLIDPPVDQPISQSSYWQTNFPLGSAIVQFFVAPSCVITTVAVALPS
jgi:hypothetical protein